MDPKHPHLLKDSNQDVDEQDQTAGMSEAQVQLALQASGVGTWDWNLITGELTWSDQKRALFGLAPGTPISYEQFLATLHPEDRDTAHQRNMQALVEKQPYQKDFRVIWPDESVHWLTDQARVICDHTGKPTHIVGATLDITARKCKETQLQQANNQIATILGSITDAFVSLDSQWRYRYVNPRMEACAGKKQEDLLGKGLWEVFPELLGTSFEDHYRTAMQTRQTMHFEAYHPILGCWVETHVYPQPDGISITLHDISERKQMEEALRKSEARFQRLIESNIVGMITTDQEGNLLEANDAFLKLLGYTQADLQAGLITWTSITSPDAQQRDREAFAEALKTGVTQPYEKEYITKEGKRAPALIGRTLFRRESEPPRFLCFVVDLSAQKEAERQKDIFLGITGHELRTPLAALKGTLQLINRRITRFVQQADQITPERDFFLQDIQAHLREGVRQVNIQTRLVNDLLDISHATTGTLIFSLHHCDLISIVCQTTEDLRLAAPDRQFILELPENRPVSVFVDPNRISQVITNYVTNALRYSQVDQPIAIGLQIQANSARVWVRNQGSGLSKEAQEKVWQCFHQIKETPRHNSTEKGLGLGLYLCKIFIEQHHGTVGVESTPDNGATFWFRLPLDNEQTMV